MINRITELPPAPSRQAPAVFSERADAFLGALPTFAVETNALADEMEANTTQALMDAVLAAEAAASAATASETALGSAETARDRAQAWADNPADVEVEPGKFSALHSAVKAALHKNTAETAAAAAQAAAGLPSLVGKAAKALVVNEDEQGVGWGSVLAQGFQEFTESGPWVKPADATWVYVECLGGGGSGAISAVNASATGGGGGDFNSKIIPASALPSSVDVVVGAGAAAQVSAAVTSGAHGVNGGVSSFGDAILAFGGSAGRFTSNGSNITYPGMRGALVAAATNDLSSYTAAHALGSFALGGFGSGMDGGWSLHGGGGGNGSGSGNVTGKGGESVYAGDGGMSATNADAFNGSFPAGGGGGVRRTAAAERTSGAGADGVVRVWWW